MPSRCRPPAVCPPQVIEKQKERATNYEDESDMSEWWSHASDDTFTPRAMPPRRPLHHPPLLPPPAPAVDAFVACGGNADKSGVVKRDTLVRIIKVDFGLTIDIEALIDALVSCTDAGAGWGAGVRGARCCWCCHHRCFLPLPCCRTRMALATSRTRSSGRCSSSRDAAAPTSWARRCHLPPQ